MDETRDTWPMAPGFSVEHHVLKPVAVSFQWLRSIPSYGRITLRSSARGLAHTRAASAAGYRE